MGQQTDPSPPRSETPVAEGPDPVPRAMLDGSWQYLADPSLDLPPLSSDPRWQPVDHTFSGRGQKPPGPWAGGWFQVLFEVEPDEDLKDLALLLEHPGASEVYLNGRLLRSFGRLAVAQGGEQPFNPRGIPMLLGLESSGTHRLSIRYTCADAARPWIGDWLARMQGAGFVASIESATRAVDELEYSRTLNVMSNLGLGGMALGFFFLHGLIYFYYRRHPGNFWFALVALGLAVNGLCTTLLKFWGHYGIWGFALLRMLNLFAAGMLLLSVLFFLSQLRSRPNFVVHKALAAAWLGLMVIAVTPWAPRLFAMLYLTWLAVFFIAIGRVGRDAWREKPEGGRWLGLSALGVSVVLMTETAKQLEWLSQLQEVGGFALGIFLILSGASCFLARRIAAEGQELEAFAQDLDQRVQERTRDLERSKREAQAASRAKSEFLAVMSHEIRTPMNAVVGLAELLDQADIPDRERKMAGTLRRSAVSLLRLIDEILDLSRIEAGSMSLRLAPFDVREVLDDVVELFSGRARQANLELTAELEGPSGASEALWIVGDSDRVYQILINLVGNALKFTEQGQVAMEARWAPAAEGFLDLVVDVRDTGIGIPEGDQKALFDPFVQVDSTSTRRVGGAGLGLAICRRLADLMGGELTLISEPGRGSSFTLKWTAELAEAPCKHPEPIECEMSKEGTSKELRPESGPEPLDFSVPVLEPLRILLAEDNPINQWVVQMLLEELGQSALLVEDGPSVLDAMAEQSFDVVVLDLHMPGMDGFQVASEIRSRFGTRPYLIAFTASVMEEDRQRCEAVGMNDFLSKPADLHKLREALLRASDLPLDAGAAG